MAKTYKYENANYKLKVAKEKLKCNTMLAKNGNCSIKLATGKCIKSIKELNVLKLLTNKQQKQQLSVRVIAKSSKTVLKSS